MDAPRIQYVAAEGGGEIAYWVAGSGPPLVLTTQVGPMLADWELEEGREFYTRLTEQYRVAQYEIRGFALSSGSVDLTDVRDLEAVVDTVGFERFALWGAQVPAVAAIAFAAQHPERVSHLVLFHSSYDLPGFHESAAGRSIQAASDFRASMHTLAHNFFGWDEASAASRWAEASLKIQSVEYRDALREAAGRFDDSTFLPRVAAPTLVMHRADYTMFPVSVSRHLVAEIADARFALLDGSTLLLSGGAVMATQPEAQSLLQAETARFFEM